jgi:hypothetical protein
MVGDHMGILGAVVFAFCICERRESTKTLGSAAIGMTLCIGREPAFELTFVDHR